MASSIVIFGASGDLTSRKLIPALYRLAQRRRIDPATRIVGVSRTPLDDAAWRKQLAESTAKYVGTSFDAESWSEFSQRVFYQPGDLSSSQDMQRLQGRLIEWEGDSVSDRLYYLATMPQLYQTAVQQLGKAGMHEESQGARRLVVEKPFGTDLESARHLNDAIHQVFNEKQIYRIDHYLGKETVQNILVLRFGNSIFEPLWNHHYIDHVQITVAEEVTVGRRGDYYDQAGVLRDMFQNHLLQLMMVIAMEPPSRFDADLVRDEKVKVLHAVRPFRGSDFATGGVRGQYAGYLADQGVPKGSQTETFAALRLLIDNWRWKGVPFFLRSGKAMSCRTTQIVIQFREPPHFLFDQRAESG